MPQRERRKYVRQVVLLPCEVEGATTGTMHVIDLSAGGCLVATRDAVPAIGAEVSLQAQVAGVNVVLTGRVARARQGWGFVVEFGALATETRQHIERFLDEVLVQG